MNDAIHSAIHAQADQVRTTSAAGDAARIPGKRGRPKSETLEERLARARQAMQDAERAIKEAERRKLIAVGAAVLSEAEADTAFKATITGILRRRVTTAQAKADIAALLIR